MNFRVSSDKYRVSSIKVRVSSIKVRVSSIKIRVSSIKVRVSSIKVRVSSRKNRVSSIKVQVRVVKFKYRVGNFEFEWEISSSSGKFPNYLTRLVSQWLTVMCNFCMRVPRNKDVGIQYPCLCRYQQFALCFHM
jgi:hypothetical protein